MFSITTLHYVTMNVTTLHWNCHALGRKSTHHHHQGQNFSLHQLMKFSRNWVFTRRLMLCSRKGKESNNFKINFPYNKGAEGLCFAPLLLTCEVNDITFTDKSSHKPAQRFDKWLSDIRASCSCSAVKIVL